MTSEKTPAREVSVILSWQAWPARERPAAAAGAAAVVLAAAGLVTTWCLLDGVGLAWATAAGAASLMALVLALSRFFLPSRFEIDEKGLTAIYALSRRRIEWKDVRRFRHNARGGFLSRRAAASRFDPWQGVHILWGHNGARVLEEIGLHLDAASENGSTKI